MNGTLYSYRLDVQMVASLPQVREVLGSTTDLVKADLTIVVFHFSANNLFGYGYMSSCGFFYILNLLVLNVLVLYKSEVIFISYLHVYVLRLYGR